MREHELKILPSFFASIVDGSKTFEVRRNDRDFAVGDMLVLHEFDPNGGGLGDGFYTDRVERRMVSYLLRGGDLGIERGFAVLGLAPPAPPTAQPEGSKKP